MYTEKDKITSMLCNYQIKRASDYSLPGLNLMRLIGIMKHDRKRERGKIKLYFSGELVTLERGELFALREKTRYRIDSMEESTFHMTLKSCN